MSGPSLKQVVLTGVVVSITAASAYMLYKRHAGHIPDAAAPQPAIQSGVGAKKPSKKKRAAQAESKESSQDSVEMNPAAAVSTGPSSKPSSGPSSDALAQLAALCELDVERILQLDVEERQKVFYALLLRGEMMMNQGGEGLTQCLSYFVKAVALVPNPGEIMMAFERSLPKEVYAGLIAALQKDLLQKTETYFEGLTKATGGRVAFAPVVTVDALGHPVQRYLPRAKADIKAGETVFTESPDVAIMMDLRDTEHCQVDLKPIDEASRVGCDKHGDAYYCSEACKKAGFDLAHIYLCAARGEAVTKPVETLREHCQTTAGPLPWLMLHYVSMLLTEELRGNGTALNGPFSHYDHLAQVFPDPSAEDKAEAALIRSVFTSANDNLADFLTDTIYASMKATLQRACFSFSLADPEAIHEAVGLPPFRKVIGTNAGAPDALALFHLAAHLPHSCVPCLELGMAPGEGARVRATALRDIKAGEALNIAYLPVDGMETPMRKERLFLTYMVNCDCPACKA